MNTILNGQKFKSLGFENEIAKVSGLDFQNHRVNIQMNGYSVYRVFQERSHILNIV